MEIDQAQEIVKLLANGVDPNTGEVFADDSPYNSPEVVCALFTVLNHIKQPNKSSAAESRPPNAGRPWRDELRQEVAKLFRQGKSIAELAQHFGRTRGAIKSETFAKRHLFAPSVVRKCSFTIEYAAFAA